MQSIVDSVQQLAARRRSQCAAQAAPPDIRTVPGLARAITWVTEGQPNRAGAIPDPPKRPAVIGVTGSPGVGKSTFIGKLAANLRARDRRVAVIAVDPTSPITGGSVLGDRLRMTPGEPDDGLFVRSLASSGQSGGLAPHCEEIARLFGAAGYEVILIETVGAGQNDTDVRNLTTDVLLLLMPGAGDEVQFAKAGVFEIATGFVINKADLPGVDTTVRQVRESLDTSHPVWPVSALRNEGLDPICDWIEQKLKP